MKILFFIGTLSTGGAERQLSVLAKGLAACGHSITVVTLFPGGEITSDIREIPDIELISLYSGRSNNIAIRLLQLVSAPFILRKIVGRTDCLYSMLEVTNLIAWLATRGKKSRSLVWGIRSSNMEGHWKMALADRLCAFISPTVRLLIVNSYAGLECLLNRGYRPQNHEVILNGIDTERFRYREDDGKKIRNELDISSSQPLVGIVARLNPMKDHPNFLRAAALVAKKVANVRFLCVGNGSNDYIAELHSLANELGLKDRIIWLGDRSDMAALYSVMDILVSSSSYGEGFSNVIGEAMSCGVPCVATDVGDSAGIVGDSTCIVEPRNSVNLAQAICRILQRKVEANWPEISRNRIEQNFSLKKSIDLTEIILSDIYVAD